MTSARPARSSRPDPACPVCGKAVGSGSVTSPFCRERCKMVDLGRWFQGEYVVAGGAAVAFDPDLIQAEDASTDRGRSDAGEGGGPSEPQA